MSSGVPYEILPYTLTEPDGSPDVTLINLNLMLVQGDAFDQEIYTPLGVLYIAGCLEREGLNVQFVDYQTYSRAAEFNAKAFVEDMPVPGPIVGISCMTNLLPFAVLVAREIKRVWPDRWLVMGGVGPAPVARPLVESFPFIDSVVDGEGELPMLDLVRGCRDALPPRQTVKDLDWLPLPSYHLLDYGLYRSSPSIITSRGCPYKCTFCTEPFNFGSTRFRGVDSVLEEIREVWIRSGATEFLVQDDIATLKRSRFFRLIREFRELPFAMTWKCFSRVDLVDDEMMQAMADSGCIQIRYGIEAGSNKTLQRIKKGFDIETAYQVAARSVRYFDSVHASFIIGYPFEGPEETLETVKQAKRFADAGVTVLMFELAPLPGSELYHEFQHGLEFSPEHYSFFVVGGFENVRRGSFEMRPDLEEIYEMVRKYPKVFPGFYRYVQPSAGIPVAIGATHRTNVRNVADF